MQALWQVNTSHTQHKMLNDEQYLKSTQHTQEYSITPTVMSHE